MPCKVEESEAEKNARLKAWKDAEIAQAIIPFQRRNDELTHENDILRETILSLVEQAPNTIPKLLPEGLLESIQANQVAHRQEDLRRLVTYFTNRLTKVTQTLAEGGDIEVIAERVRRANKVIEKLDLVAKADPSKPLEPQLGFDPDDY